MIPPEVVPYFNLALNLVTIVVVAALAVWLKRSHISNVELKGQLLGVILSLRLMVNGHGREGKDKGGPQDTDAS